MQNSEGLAIARERGFSTTHEGIEGAQKLSEWKNIKLVFDATSAYAHAKHAMICASEGKQMIDLTPAALGPFCVPVVNMDEHLDSRKCKYGNMWRASHHTYGGGSEPSF